MPPQNFDTSNVFTIQTLNHNWVIPYNCELLKVLLEQQKIKASDLCFDCNNQCKDFVKKIFLLALEDETKHHLPSMLAEFGRDLIKLQATQHYP